MRWAVDILKLTVNNIILTIQKVMKSFYVAWSNEPDLKLAWSSESALFKLSPLGPPWRQFIFNKCRFCFFLSNRFTKSCYRMINWKNLLWMSSVNTSLEKGFYLRYVTTFLFSIFLNTFITVNFICGHTFVMMFAKNDQFYGKSWKFSFLSY